MAIPQGESVKTTKCFFCLFLYDGINRKEGSCSRWSRRRLLQPLPRKSMDSPHYRAQNITTVCIHGVGSYRVSGVQDGHFSPTYSDENPTAEGGLNLLNQSQTGRGLRVRVHSPSPVLIPPHHATFFGSPWTYLSEHQLPSPASKLLASFSPEMPLAADYNQQGQPRPHSPRMGGGLDGVLIQTNSTISGFPRFHSTGRPRDARPIYRSIPGDKGGSAAPGVDGLSGTRRRGSQGHGRAGLY
jgi:hypothetical protein